MPHFTVTTQNANNAANALRIVGSARWRRDRPLAARSEAPGVVLWYNKHCWVECGGGVVAKHDAGANSWKDWQVFIYILDVYLCICVCVSVC